jgi:hypothetical protein
MNTADFSTWTDLALETGLNVARTNHAVYLPAMEAEAERRRGSSDFSKERAAGWFPSIEAFYDARPERRTSGEADYGVQWQANGLRWPKWRVSYIQATGEIYADRQSSGPERWAGTVRVLGVVPPDPGPGPGAAGSLQWNHENRYYRTLDVILDGWADPDISGHDLAWVEQRLAAAGRPA